MSAPRQRILLNMAVLVPHVGMTRNGARRWLPLGFTQLQPSELAKWAIVIFLAWWLTRAENKVEKFWTGFVPTVAVRGVEQLPITWTA